MARVILQLPDPEIEDMTVDLYRVPVAGDFLEFAEEYHRVSIAGETFEVRSVIFSVEAHHLMNFPVVVLRATD